MESIIAFNGITTSPADTLSTDGESTIFCNACLRGNAVAAARIDGENITAVPAGYTLRYIHDIKGVQKNFILTKDDKLYFTTEDTDIPTEINMPEEFSFTEMNAVGNTLLLYSEQCVYYVLFSEKTYKYLGDRLPDVDLQFGLLAAEPTNDAADKASDDSAREDSNFYVHNIEDYDPYGTDGDKSDKNFLNYPSTGDCQNSQWLAAFAGIHHDFVNYSDYRMAPLSVKKDFNATKQEAVTNAIMAAVTKYIREEIHENNYFIYPFFVRYALKLYDGTYTHHSPPVLMIPCSGATPLVYRHKDDTDALIKALATVLDYRVVNSENIDSWNDIVKGITIFVSSPIYTIDTSGTIERPEIYDEYKSGDGITRRFGVFAKLIGNIEDAEKELANNTTLTYGYNMYLPALRNYSNDQVFCNNKKLKSVKTEIANNGISMADTESLPYHLWYLIGYELPKFDKDLSNRITDYSHFYKLCDIDNDDLPTDSAFHLVKFTSGILNGIEAQEELPDDYDSHMLTTFAHSYVYNSRLNVYDIRRRLFDGFRPYTAFPMANGARKYIGETVTETTVDTYTNEKYSLTSDASASARIVQTYIYVRLKKDGLKYVVRASNYDPNFNYGIPYWYYYPDADAYEAVIFFVLEKGSIRYRQKITLSLIEHPALHGAYYFDLTPKDLTDTQYITDLVYETDPLTGELSPVKAENENTAGAIYNGTDSDGNALYAIATDKKALDEAISEETQWIIYSQKIFATDINNPFIFPLENRLTFNANDIIGIAANTEPISTGQFGQYPLLVFTSSGIYAASISSEGEFASIHPMSREVCSNAQSIVQTGSSVLFVTERGLMSVGGGTVKCLSTNINDEAADIPFVSESTNSLHVENAVEFMQEAQVAYDYPNRRVFIYKSTDKRMLVLYLENNSWATMYRDDTKLKQVLRHVNNYPDLYMQTSDEVLKLIRSTNEQSGNTTDVTILTRPFKLGTHGLKSFIEAQYVGVFSHKPRSVLFGSRDGINYVKLGYSDNFRLPRARGHSFRFFRLLLTLKMKPEDALAGIKVKFDTRYPYRYK